MALFALLSLPVFYAAARRISTGDLFPALATTVFGVMMNLAVTPYRPVNRAYVPLFYALAMYFFSGAYRGRRLQLFMTWVVLGMCVQLHLATGVLALTLLYHAAARGVRFMAWQSFIGLFVILAMHAPVIVDLTMKPGTAPFEELIALADAEFHLAPSVATYTKIVLAWIAGIAATSGGVAVIYLVRGAMAALGLIRDRWRSFDIGVLSTVHVLLVIFGLSVIKALKDPTDIDAGYVISAVPFVAILVAQSASRDVARLTAHPDQWRNTVLPWFILSIVALTIFSAALAVRWTQVPIMCRHRATMRLDDQLKIADEIQAKTVGLARFHVEQLLFQPDPETGEPRLRSRSYLTYEGLLRWTKRMPPFWERSASSFIGVYLRPRGAATPDYMAAQLIDSRVLSEMQTGCMDVTIFQQPGPIPIIP
ncbi:hypothetical protein K8I61_06295 [bacterium]|nr:hypothetical protein [bacterium]